MLTVQTEITATLITRDTYICGIKYLKNALGCKCKFTYNLFTYTPGHEYLHIPSQELKLAEYLTLPGEDHKPYRKVSE